MKANQEKKPYDHTRNAGNRGDVWKHFILSSVTDHISQSAQSSQGFRYFDSHAGAPIHNLLPKGKWMDGIGRVLEGCRSNPEHGYFDFARKFFDENQYPASWQFAADRLARGFSPVHVSLRDNSREVAAKYPSKTEIAAQNVTVHFSCANGFENIPADSDLTFIDPPFSPVADRDWRALTRTCQVLIERKSRFLAWYPVYWPTRPQRLVNRSGCKSYEVIWADFSSKPSQNLKGCGMLVSPQLKGLLKEDNLRGLAQCLEGQLYVRRPQ